MAGMHRSITLGLLFVGLASLCTFCLLGCDPETAADAMDERRAASEAANDIPTEPAELYGVWEGEFDRVDPSMPNDGKRGTINYLRLTIRRDRTFRMLDAGMPKSGTYRIVNGKALLKTTRVMDRPIEQLGSGARKMNLEMTAELQDDGTLLFMDPGGFDEGYVTLVRRTQPADSE